MQSYLILLILKKPCPEDVYDFWAPWTECSISCGGEGVQTRKRNCATSFFRYSPEFPLSKPCRDNPGTEVSFTYFSSLEGSINKFIEIFITHFRLNHVIPISAWSQSKVFTLVPIIFGILMLVF